MKNYYNLQSEKNTITSVTQNIEDSKLFSEATKAFSIQYTKLFLASYASLFKKQIHWTF